MKMENGRKSLLRAIKVMKPLILYKLAGCSATLHVFTKKNPKKNPKIKQNKTNQKKYSKKIFKKSKKICLNYYAGNIGSACDLGALGPLVWEE
jgi:hypothetical protein